MKALGQIILRAFMDSVPGIIVGALLSGALIKYLAKVVAAFSSLVPAVVEPLSWVLGLLTALVFLIVLLSARHQRVMIPIDRPRYRFDIRRISINYENPAAPIYRRKYKLTALSKGVDRVVDSYAWTGRNIKNLEVATPDCEIKSIGQNGLYTMFEVKFPHVIAKGKSFEFDVIWELDNSSLDAIPFLAMTVTQPTKKVEFEIRLPRHAYDGGVYLKSSAHMQSETSVEASGHTFEDGHVIIPVSNPKLYSYYEVHWRWKANPL